MALNLGKCLLFCLLILGGVGRIWPQTAVTLSFRSPWAHQYFLHPGYLHPAEGAGAWGLFANPAALGATGPRSLALGLTLPQEASLEFDLILLDSSDTYDRMLVPIRAHLKEEGGLNYLGLSYTLGRLTLGLGYSSPSSIHFLLDTLNAWVTGEATYTYPDTLLLLTPPALLSIETQHHYRLHLQGSGMARVSERSFLLGLGTALGPITFGAGVRWSRYQGSGNLSILAPLQDTLTVMVTERTGFWRPEVGTATVVDTFYTFQLHYRGEGDAFHYLVGFQARPGIFRVGVTLEFGQRFELAGNFSEIMRRATGPPRTVEILGAQADPISQRLILDLRLSGAEKDTMVRRFAGPFRHVPYRRIRAGFSLGLLSGFGEATVASRGRSFHTYQLGLSLHFPVVFARLHAGILGRLDGLSQVGTLTPLRAYLYGGGGVTLRARPAGTGIPFETDLALVWNLSGLLSRLVEQTGQVESLNVPSLGETTTLSLGIRAVF